MKITKIKKYDIFQIILCFIFMLFCIISAIFINPICLVLILSPIGGILFILYRYKDNNDDKT